MNLTFEIYLKLFGIAMFSVGLSAIMYVLKRKTAFGRIKHWEQQVIIGVLFGIVAILGTELGVDIGGATANARDAAPLCAGLLFGGPAGIISGIIGGIWRWIASPWAGAYSKVACSVSTCLAGFFAAFLRKFVFDNKRPNLLMAATTGGVMEIIHLTILFLTHMSDSEKAFVIVRTVTFPMVLCNGISVLLSVFIVTTISKGINIHEKRHKPLSQIFQTPLLIAFVVAFALSTIFVYQLQSYSAEENAISIMKLNIEDAKREISIKDVSQMSRHHVGTDGFVVIYDSEYNIISGKVSVENSDLDITSFRIDSDEDFFSLEKFSDDVYFYADKYDDYYVVAFMSADDIYSTRDDLSYINSYLEIIIYGALLIMIYVIIKKVVSDKLHYVNNKLSKIIDGELETKLSIDSSEEFYSLTSYINTTVDALKNYIDEEKTRIDKELAFAKSIQHAALPSVFPPFPGRDDFSIYATMDTAKEVGGDFYDFYLLDKTHLAILIADVSGKGIPAAMFMMNAKTVIKSLAETGISVEEVMTRANEKLCEGNEADMFVTAWMGIIDLENGHVEFANAGHNPPLVYRSGEGFEYLKARAGLVLAGMEGMKYKKQEFDLKPGDKIFLYTDGITEATDSYKKLYGEDRLQKYLNDNASLDVEQTLIGVKADVDAFVGEAEQFDDMTMLEFKFGEEKMSTMKFKQFPATDAALADVTDFITQELESAGASMKSVMQISVVLEEIFVNVAHYAYGENEGTVDIGFDMDDCDAVIQFKDKGVPFDPFAKEDPDITLSAEERSIGGLGIFMTKKIMDKYDYEYKDGLNTVTLRKKI